MLLSNRLKQIRLQSNMLQREIAAELDIDTAYIASTKHYYLFIHIISFANDRANTKKIL